APPVLSNVGHQRSLRMGSRRRTLSPTRLRPFPVLAEQFVFDLTVLRAWHRVFELHVERPRVREAGLFHDPAGGRVDRHRLGVHPARAEFAERPVDKGPGTFGGVALPPGGPPKAVTELGLVRGVAVPRAQAQPADEFAGGLLVSRPGAVAVEQLVVLQEPRQDYLLDLDTRRGSAPADVPHDLRIAVQLDQQVHVIAGEPAEHEPLGLEYDVHHSSNVLTSENAARWR